MYAVTESLLLLQDTTWVISLFYSSWHSLLKTRYYLFIIYLFFYPQLTCSQRQWLHSSVGRASQWYREITGSNPIEVLNFFFSGFFTQLHKINCIHCDDHFFIFISFPQFINDLFYIIINRHQIIWQGDHYSLANYSGSHNTP